MSTEFELLHGESDDHLFVKIFTGKVHTMIDVDELAELRQRPNEPPTSFELENDCVSNDHENPDVYWP